MRRLSLPTLMAVLVLLSITTLAAAQGPQSALGTAFTYQGRLADGSGPANGSYDFQLQLFDAAAGGAQLGATVTAQAVTVSGGLFSVNIDFGAVFDGRALFTVSGGLFSVNIDFGAVFDGRALFLNVGVRPGGSAGAYTTLSPRQPLTAVPYALALPGLRTQMNATSPNVIGGFSGNSVSAGVVGATISGGGVLIFDTRTSPSINRVTDNFSTISGGTNNQAGNADTNTTNTVAATVGGGDSNIASAIATTVSGGNGNTASGGGSTVGGGTGNTATGLRSAVAGGSANQATGQNATVGGGDANIASVIASTVSGGNGNTASGGGSTVGGGTSNTASGFRSTVPGGFNNRASGAYSFAAGKGAVAPEGSFVWEDATIPDANTYSTFATNAFLARASGGVTFITTPYFSTEVGATLAPGSGSWSSVSDRSAKTNIVAITPRDVLARVAGLPMQTWSYKTQNTAIRHIGPMAQDFYATFGVGEDNTHISTVDADGVALAAIQGLYQANQEQAARIAALEARLASADTNAGGFGGGSPALAGMLGGGLAMLVLIGSGMLLLWRRRTALGLPLSDVYPASRVMRRSRAAQAPSIPISSRRSVAASAPARTLGAGSAPVMRKAKPISTGQVAPLRAQHRIKAAASQQRRGER